jgi:hypothetical protein
MLAFCCPALAGEIPNPPLLAGEMPNPQPQTVTAQEPTVNGEMQNDAPDSLTQLALDLLALLPSLP